MLLKGYPLSGDAALVKTPRILLIDMDKTIIRDPMRQRNGTGGRIVRYLTGYLNRRDTKIETEHVMLTQDMDHSLLRLREFFHSCVVVTRSGAQRAHAIMSVVDGDFKHILRDLPAEAREDVKAAWKDYDEALRQLQVTLPHVGKGKGKVLGRSPNSSVSVIPTCPSQHPFRLAGSQTP